MNLFEKIMDIFMMFLIVLTMAYTIAMFYVIDKDFNNITATIFIYCVMVSACCLFTFFSLLNKIRKGDKLDTSNFYG